MFVSHVNQVEKKTVTHPEAKDVIRQALIGPAQGWEGWVMRQFIIAPGGYTPRHTHPWPHINYVVGGSGSLFLEGTDHAIGIGAIAYVPSDKLHQFQNTGSEPLIFLCIVPEEGDK